MVELVLEAQMRLTDMIEKYEAEILMPDDWPIALGYGPWVEEVWANYLSNAIKYGGRPPRAELGADRLADGMVRFWIKDNGPGLNPEEQSKLFVPFTQLAQVHTRGHGLGLSIVHRIVEKLGGQVAVKSESIPGQGSMFSFTLPSVTGD
jgi:signal transduction histidine kinase